MTTPTRVETVTTADGTFHAHLALPSHTPAPAVVLVHEVFSVNDYIKGVAGRLARLGYVVIAPDLFWRIDPDHPLGHDDAGIGEAFERVAGLDIDLAVSDLVTTLDHVASLPEVIGPAAILGFCLGGTLALAAGIAAGPAAVVSYYGSGVGDLLGGAADLSCPALFVFGGNDPFIDTELPGRVTEAFVSRDDVEVHLFEDSGHAFDNFDAPMFHDPVAAIEAWGITAVFLDRHLRR